MTKTQADIMFQATRLGNPVVSLATGAVRFGNVLNGVQFATNVRTYVGVEVTRIDENTYIVPALADE